MNACRLPFGAGRGLSNALGGRARAPTAGVVVALFVLGLTGCGDSNGPSRSEQKQARALMSPLLPAMATLSAHFTGNNTNDATIERDATRMDTLAARTGADAERALSGDLRARVVSACRALQAWVAAIRRARPKRRDPTREFVESEHVTDVFATAALLHDQALDAAGAPRSRERFFAPSDQPLRTKDNSMTIETPTGVTVVGAG